MTSRINEAVVKWCLKWEEPVADAVRRAAPLGKTPVQLEMFSPKAESTHLRASIRPRVRGRLGETKIEIISSVPYALIVRDGRGIVTPKHANVLHWVNEWGQHIFAMQSKAVKPNPYHKKGWTLIRASATKELKDEVTKAAMEGWRGIVKTVFVGGIKTFK